MQRLPKIDAAIVALAVAARVAAVLALQSHTVPRSTYEHGEIAANLLHGRGFAVKFLGVDGPTSQQAPFYPFVVAAAFALGGPDGVETPRALLILELGQALLGGVLAAAVLALGREALPGRPGTARLGAVVAAVHPTLVYSATHVQVAPWAAAFLTAMLAAAYRLGRTGRGGDAARLGVWLALLALTDPILALAAPAAGWIVLRGRGEMRRALAPLALAGVVATAGVAPWIARNYRVHGEFVAIKSTFGYAFWQGNNALSRGTDKVVRAEVDRALEASGPGLAAQNAALWKARHVAGYIDDIALTKDDYRMLASVGEPERSRVLFRRALADLRRDPGRYPRLCLARLRAFLFFDETNPKTRHLVYRAGHLGLTALAALGWLAMGAEARRRLAPTALAFGLITAFHTLTIVSARFHVPLEPLMGLWGGAGLAHQFGRWGASTPAADHVEGVGVVVRRLALRNRPARVSG